MTAPSAPATVPYRVYKPAGRPGFGRWLLPLYVTIAFVFLLIPIVYTFVFSFNDANRSNISWNGFTFKNWLNVCAQQDVCTAFGNQSVERVFTWVSILLYGVYAAFVVFALSSFGGRISQTFASAGGWNEGWLSGGLTYAGYNIIGAVVILPVTRHLMSDRDAIVAGIAAGPLAMLPAFLFFICMCAFVPEITGVALPSDYLLARLDQPWFRYLFQIMIFAALLESGTGAVHAVNERISTVWLARTRTPLSARARGAIALALLIVCMLIADRVGLVALIANGYRALAYLLITVYVVPLLTIGLWRLWKRAPSEWVTP